MSEKRVTTDELEAIAFDEGGRISLGASEARYTDAGGVHYVADLPRADFKPGEHVVYRSHPNARPEAGTVVRDDLGGLVFVDYGGGRVMSTRRQDLTREMSA